MLGLFSPVLQEGFITPGCEKDDTSLRDSGVFGAKPGPTPTALMSTGRAESNQDFDMSHVGLPLVTAEFSLSSGFRGLTMGAASLFLESPFIVLQSLREAL